MKPLAPTAAPGQTYGQAGQQLAAQQAVPIAPQPVPTGGSPVAPTPPGPLPGSLGPLDRPTDRPEEPLTAGAPVGPGPNSLSLPTPVDPLLAGLAFLNQIPNLPQNLAVVRDQLRVQTR